MGIFDALTGTQSAQKQISPQEMRQEIGRVSADPAAYLQQRGFTIPQGMSDPRQITRHLLSSGQVGSSRLAQVLRMLGFK